MDLFSENASERAIYLEYDGDMNHNKVPDPTKSASSALAATAS